MGPLYGEDRDLRRSSAVTTGDSLARPPPAVMPTAPPVVQGSKSYMDVSMSAKRTSSSAKSERNPEGEEEEEGGEGEEEMSTRPPGGSVGRVSIDRRSAQRASASNMPATSGLALMALQSLGRPVGAGEWGAKWEGWVSGVGAGEVVTVIVLAAAVLVMAVGGPNSMSLKVDGKSSLDVGGTGTLGDAWLRSAEGNGGGGTGGGDKGGVGGDGVQKAESPPSSSNKEAGVRQASRGAGQASIWFGQAWDAWQLGGTIGWGEGGRAITGINSAGGCDTCAVAADDKTPKDGGASRKPSSMGSSGGGDGGRSSGRREPSCLSSSWMRRSMLLMRTRRSRLGSPSGRWLYNFIREMLKMVWRCKVYDTFERPSGPRPCPPPTTDTSSVLPSRPSSSSSSFRFAPLPNIYLENRTKDT